jgi:hypothetical protein
VGIGRRIVSAVAGIWLTTGLASAAGAEPLRIFYFIWVGYGPLFVAQEKGFFAQEGLEVELINNEVHAAAFGGLYTGQVDAIAGGLQDAPAYSEPDEGPLVCVLALDDDRGGTGIVATKEVRTVADLKASRWRSFAAASWSSTWRLCWRGLAWLRPISRWSTSLPRILAKPFCCGRWTPRWSQSLSWPKLRAPTMATS